MSKFKKYQHIERLGTPEVQNIELGECWVFPKLDGANASAWMGDDGEVCLGSRNRQIGIGLDNHGFNAWLQKNGSGIIMFLNKYPNLRLYGEWLVPHSLKTYRQDVWRNFYVFDVCFDLDDSEESRYLTYDEYKPMLEEFGLSYVVPITKITNGSYQDFVDQLPKNNFLIEDGKGAGEGIVIKNYNFINKYGRTTWAKIVTSEFKEVHIKTMGASETVKSLVEQDIAQKFVTEALVDKEYSKIAAEPQGWSSKQIIRLLNTVFYSVVKEEAWNFIKEHRLPLIDFKRLQHFVFAQVRTAKPELF